MRPVFAFCNASQRIILQLPPFYCSALCYSTVYYIAKMHQTLMQCYELLTYYNVSLSRVHIAKKIAHVPQCNAMQCKAIATPGQCCWENWGWQRECEGILGPASHTNNDYRDGDDDEQTVLVIMMRSVMFKCVLVRGMNRPETIKLSLRPNAGPCQSNTLWCLSQWRKVDGCQKLLWNSFNGNGNWIVLSKVLQLTYVMA